MALIKCPECGREVSDTARACPCCAYPLGAPTLIEQTAKRWKSVQILGAVLMLLGLVLGLVFLYTTKVSDSSVRPVLACLVPFLVAGVSVYVVGRVGAWWHHG